MPRQVPPPARPEGAVLVPTATEPPPAPRGGRGKRRARGRAPRMRRARRPAARVLWCGGGKMAAPGGSAGAAALRALVQQFTAITGEFGARGAQSPRGSRGRVPPGSPPPAGRGREARAEAERFRARCPCPQSASRGAPAVLGPVRGRALWPAPLPARRRARLPLSGGSEAPVGCPGGAGARPAPSCPFPPSSRPRSAPAAASRSRGWL